MQRSKQSLRRGTTIFVYILQYLLTGFEKQRHLFSWCKCQLPNIRQNWNYWTKLRDFPIGPNPNWIISLQKSFKQFRSGLLFTTSSISGPALNLHIMSLPLCSRLSSRLWPRKTFYLNKLQEALRSCRYINMDEQFQEISRFHLPWMFFLLEQFNYVINVKGYKKQLFLYPGFPSS